jgi:hypothetical protein
VILRIAKGSFSCIEAKQVIMNAIKKLIDIFEQRIKDKMGEELGHLLINIKMESNTAISLLYDQ